MANVEDGNILWDTKSVLQDLHQSVMMTMKTQGNKSFTGVEMMKMCEKLKKKTSSHRDGFKVMLNLIHAIEMRS